MFRHLPSSAWIVLAGLSVGGVLAAGLHLNVQADPVEVEPEEIALADLAEPLESVPVAYEVTVPGIAMPVLDIEHKLWAGQEDLLEKRLLLPIQGLTKQKLIDSFKESRGTKRHDAIDLGAPRGRPILAVEDGTIRRIKWHPRGGLTIYQYGPEGRYSYYYAHLQKLAKGLAEGCMVQRGDVIGYVGSTGSAAPSSPHLHFEVRKIENREAWWSGKAINPYPLFLAGEERAPRLILNQLAD